jgi:hypothetical protein
MEKEKILIPKQTAIDIAEGELEGADYSNYEIIDHRELVGTSRWSIHYRITLKDIASGKFYGARYSQAATESQDESPFEYAGEQVEFEEVFPTQITVYR